MSVTRTIKLLGLILGVAALNTVVFSPGFIGIELGGSALSSAIGATILAASGIALTYGCYALLFKSPAALPVKEIKTHEDYVEALSLFRRIKVLEDDMSLALHQLERMRKKKNTLLDILKQRFDPAELSYKKFAAVIQEVEKLFYLNVRSILNRLRTFDESEFESVSGRKPSTLSQELLQARKSLYGEYLSFTKQSLATNEEILLKLDQLLLEISRLDSLEPGDIDGMPCMQEIDALIKQTPYYKN
ncbi:hypothetical protein [Paenibacillus sacheonensis]|uniref:5-bromo-4-chloroindolyl phosphate hydrolysis protein n=1 Tax=Paenibacillus sacheonensis TaxID=742054 RepID=A0A7X4YSR1_9BACL|nr:hypothetical protein [Paenibacillus sacheonensis]MBM7568137.1 hypothetical protein [Paenibacillus sacheonensis]NBC71861.1 hypothetical protein [Paenibacillus sacheonensis]